MTATQKSMSMRAVVFVSVWLAVTELAAQPFVDPYRSPHSGPGFAPFYPPANTYGWAPPMHPQPNMRDRFGGWESAWERWNQRMFGDSFANMFGDMGADFEVDATLKAQGQMDASGTTQGQGAARGSQRSNASRYYGQPYAGPPPVLGNPYGFR
jgi:hypothetical protein